jgi:hypothetical protein
MKREIWISLFLMGVLLFNWPFITIFEASLSTYLFSVWGIFIALMFLASHFSERGDGDK